MVYSVECGLTPVEIGETFGDIVFERFLSLHYAFSFDDDLAYCSITNLNKNDIDSCLCLIGGVGGTRLEIYHNYDNDSYALAFLCSWSMENAIAFTLQECLKSAIFYFYVGFDDGYFIKSYGGNYDTVITNISDGDNNDRWRVRAIIRDSVTGYTFEVGGDNYSTEQMLKMRFSDARSYLVF